MIFFILYLCKTNDPLSCNGNSRNTLYYSLLKKTNNLFSLILIRFILILRSKEYSIFNKLNPYLFFSSNLYIQ